MTVAELEEPTTAVYPDPFGVEFGTHRNNDILLQCLAGERIRGAIDSRNGVINKQTGDEVVPVDQAISMAGFPKVPGQQVHVNPEKGLYTILDPLHGDEELCARIKRWMDRRSGMRTTEKLGGVPVRKGELDLHTMKTLCRELLQFVKSGDAQFVRGSALTIADVERMPGMFLYQPGLRTDTLMPRYEDDYPAYLNNLRRHGG